MKQEPKYLTDVQLVAEMPGLFSVSWLRQQRTGHGPGQGPPFVRIGRNIRYEYAVVRKWLTEKEERVAC